MKFTQYNKLYNYVLEHDLILVGVAYNLHMFVLRTYHNLLLFLF